MYPGLVMGCWRSFGLLRGWRPGYRVSLWVDRSVGWRRILEAIGILIGAGFGGFIGLALGWWAVLPVFIGLFYGARLGLKAGSKLWLFGTQYGWERIWAGIGALCTGLLGWQLALVVQRGQPFPQLAGSFSTWITDQSASLVLIALALGALGGALGGAIAGTLPTFLHVCSTCWISFHSRRPSLSEYRFHQIYIGKTRLN